MHAELTVAGEETREISYVHLSIFPSPISSLSRVFLFCLLLAPPSIPPFPSLYPSSTAPVFPVVSSHLLADLSSYVADFRPVSHWSPPQAASPSLAHQRMSLPHYGRPSNMAARSFSSARGHERPRSIITATETHLFSLCQKLQRYISFGSGDHVFLSRPTILRSRLPNHEQQHQQCHKQPSYPPFRSSNVLPALSFTCSPTTSSFHTTALLHLSCLSSLPLSVSTATTTNSTPLS